MRSRGLIGGGVGLALVMSARMALASPPSAEQAASELPEPEQSSVGEQEARKKKLYAEGQEQFDKGNFAEALELFDEFYDMSSCGQRDPVLPYLIAALLGLYESDPDPGHLERAVSLMKEHNRELDPTKPNNQETIRGYEARIEKIEDVLAKIRGVEERRAALLQQQEVDRRVQEGLEASARARNRRLYALGLAGVVAGVGVMAAGAVAWSFDGRCTSGVDDPLCPNVYESSVPGAVGVGVGAALVTASAVLVAGVYQRASPDPGRVDTSRYPGLLWAGVGGGIAGAGALAGGVALLVVDGQCEGGGHPATCPKLRESTRSGAFLVAIGTAALVSAATLIGVGLRGPKLRVGQAQLEPGLVLRF